MDEVSTLRTIRALADGADPMTGEKLPDDSIYNRPPIIRALYKAIEALERVERIDRRRGQLPDRTGERWTDEEDEKLSSAFDSGMSVRELAKSHARTMGGIEARLVKLGKMRPENREH